MQDKPPSPDAPLPPDDAPACGPLRVIYYTDPLCCWSWAMEPHWQRLRHEFGSRLLYEYRMGGLLPDWETFRDPLNAVSRPGQMGPHWMYVRSITGVPLEESIWREDPPASSYPACLAVKAAQRQGPTQAERYLRRVREAVMVQRRNVARHEVLLELAGECTDLDLARFTHDLEAADTLAAFREDLREATYRGIGRFPTLVFLRPDGKGVLLVGYRPYPILRAALHQLAPTLEPERTLVEEALASSHGKNFAPTNPAANARICPTE